ncbi:hypothetical protein GCM10022284_26510 [Streptomyces hundungensis]
MVSQSTITAPGRPSRAGFAAGVTVSVPIAPPEVSGVRPGHMMLALRAAATEGRCHPAETRAGTDTESEVGIA